jgi:hypothetical protein
MICPGIACRMALRLAAVALLLLLPLSYSLAVDSEYAVIPSTDAIIPLAELPETIVEQKFSPKAAAIPPTDGAASQEESEAAVLIENTNSH